MKTIRRFGDYLKSHMSASLIGTGVLMFLAAMLFFHGFLQKEYMKYLLAETTKTETAVLQTTASNINSTLKDTIRMGADIALDPDLLEYVEEVLGEDGSTIRSMQRLSSRMASVTHFRGDIAATAIVTEDGLLCEYGRHWKNSGYADLWTDAYLEELKKLYDGVVERAKAKMVVSYEIGTSPMKHESFPDMTFFHIAFPLIGEHVRKEECHAVVVLTLRLDSMVRFQMDNSNQEIDYISEYLTDADGKVLYSTNEQYLGKRVDDLPHSGTGEVKTPLAYMGWDLHSDIDSSQMEEVVRRMFRQGVGVYLILLLLCIIIWQLVLWRILQPVKFIGKSMEEIQSGDSGAKIDIRGKHELWQLAEQYNHTVEALEEQREATRREFEEKTISIQRWNAAEKEALESQINAHFLCNTLNVINYSAMENGDEEVSILLKNLSGILYYAFAPETKSVTLGEEIEWVRQYLYLQKYRLMDVFDYEITIPEEYLEWPCCKLFLQPFVENSILHGFEGWDNGGKLRVEAKETRGRLVVTVEDNGQGMAPETRDIIQKILENPKSFGENSENQVGIGIQNVVARLRMYYGAEMEVRLNSQSGKGTCFTMFLPIPADMLDEAIGTGEDEFL
ncbi:MAG: histidine kinase [Blautia sp.]|nr:histidine kinase [Blautia sp.]